MEKVYKTLTAGDLKNFLNDIEDSREIRVWCEITHQNGSKSLVGKRPIRIESSPFESYCSLIAIECDKDRSI